VPDLVGITVNVDTSKRAYEIAGSYRQRGIPVVLGGIHPSANPDEALEFADSVCIGEAEELWGTILADVENGSLQRIYRNDTRVDLKTIPAPRWELLDTSKYLYTNILYTSKGCPFKCDFCYNSCDYANLPHRNRPVEDVVEEVKSLGTKHVMFIDDNFIGNPAWTKEFIKAIKPLGVKWNAAVSANIIAHLDLLDEMKESGCKSLFIGFETVNEASIKSVSKHQNKVGLYDALIDEIHSRGIMINASIVFGFDHDSVSVFKDTLDWLVRNKIETVTAHILTPYPGTKLFDSFKEEGRITDFDWSRYNTSQVVFAPKHMTPDELYSGYTWVYKEFYTIKNILKRLPDNRKQWIPYLLFNLAYRKFGKATSRLAHIIPMRSIGRVARQLSYGID
jgi:radical SAM superfamily enzyme YgiQ (UPF0313 family)